MCWTHFMNHCLYIICFATVLLTIIHQKLEPSAMRMNTSNTDGEKIIVMRNTKYDRLEYLKPGTILLSPANLNLAC